eukprot:3941064-Rhodomonas_salina.1
MSFPPTAQEYLGSTHHQPIPHITPHSVPSSSALAPTLAFRYKSLLQLAGIPYYGRAVSPPATTPHLIPLMPPGKSTGRSGDRSSPGSRDGGRWTSEGRKRGLDAGLGLLAWRQGCAGPGNGQREKKTENRGRRGEERRGEERRGEERSTRVYGVGTRGLGTRVPGTGVQGVGWRASLLTRSYAKSAQSASQGLLTAACPSQLSL